METANGVKIAGAPNMAGRMGADASAVYACNLIAFATLLVKDGELKPIWNIEILKTALVTHGGRIVHPALHPSLAPRGRRKA